MLRWLTHDLKNKTQELKDLPKHIVRVSFVSNTYLNLIFQCCEQGMRSEFKGTLIESFSVSILKYDLPIYLTSRNDFSGLTHYRYQRFLRRSEDVI